MFTGPFEAGKETCAPSQQRAKIAVFALGFVLSACGKERPFAEAAPTGPDMSALGGASGQEPAASGAVEKSIVAQRSALSRGPSAGGACSYRPGPRRAGAALVASERQLPYALAVWPNNSFERTRSAAVARFAVRRLWRAAQLMIR